MARLIEERIPPVLQMANEIYSFKFCLTFNKVKEAA